MTEIKYLGARLEEDVFKMVEDTAKEEHVDKTKALKELIIIGRKQYLIRKNLFEYGEGKCSIDKAAEKSKITINEMMKEAVKSGIQSSETIEEYKKGLELLKRL